MVGWMGAGLGVRQSEVWVIMVDELSLLHKVWCQVSEVSGMVCAVAWKGTGFSLYQGDWSMTAVVAAEGIGSRWTVAGVRRKGLYDYLIFSSSELSSCYLQLVLVVVQLVIDRYATDLIVARICGEE